MTAVERYCSVLGVSPDTPVEEMERIYVSFLQELNGRQEALAGDPDAQDAIEQRMRDLMEAYAYLARHHDVFSAAAKAETAEKPGTDELYVVEEEAVALEEPPPEPEPPKLLSDSHLRLLFRLAGGLIVCAVVAILLGRYVVRRDVPQVPLAPANGMSKRSAGQVVQAPILTAGAVKDEDEPKQRKVAARRSVLRGEVSKAGAFPLRGRVVAIASGSEYSYLHVGLPRGHIWLAIPQTSAIHVGDRIESPSGPQILNYHSSVLRRTVDRIVFPSVVRINGRILHKGQPGTESP